MSETTSPVGSQPETPRKYQHAVELELHAEIEPGLEEYRKFEQITLDSRNCQDPVPDGLEAFLQYGRRYRFTLTVEELPEASP